MTLSWKWLTFKRGAYLLLGLNFLDALSTQVALELGVAYEANPLMAWAWQFGPAAFWLAKFALVSLGLILVGALASEQVARRVIVNGCLLYTAVFLIHLCGWLAYWGS